MPVMYAREPSYDFEYEDVEGKLTDCPGTRCFIECKATTADVSSTSAPFPITTNEWALAQQVHRLAAAAAGIGGGAAVQYIIFRVHLVGCEGGPKLAARAKSACEETTWS